MVRMSPNPDDAAYKSSLGIQHFPNREEVFKNADLWLDDKKILDNTEGLWRVYEGLYDLTDFIKKHPGGKFWLEITKGTDITEAFESHHISTKPEETLKKYFVREAKTSRWSPFTFENDGFYKTLKRNVREALKTVPKGAATTSNRIIDSLMVLAFVSAILANWCWSYALGALSGLLLSSAVVASHNYYHRKDNFRMYYSDIGMVQSREWRILHVLSHHQFTNTVADLQAYLSEPLLQMFPHGKPAFFRYVSWIYAPIIFWPALFHYLFLVRMYHWILRGKYASKVDLLPLLLPLAMYIFSGQALLATVGMWILITAVDSFWFCLIGFATTHFHPDVFIDGDTPRPMGERDWGINQLDTVTDRYEVTGSHFLVLVTFGDHALHHLFPTFDHGILQHIFPVVHETMKQFNLNIRMSTHADMIGGYFRQLAKVKPNPVSPTLIQEGKPTYQDVINRKRR